MITDLFNLVWTSDRIPTAWRKGNVPASSKAGPWTPHMQQLSPNHSSVIDKLFAAVLTERLNKTFTPHDHQSAFRKGTAHSIRLAFTALEKQRQRDGCALTTFFLDMQKAYDKVWHAGLFWKLHKNGITGNRASSMNYTQTQLAHRSSKGRLQSCIEYRRALLKAAPCHQHCSTCSLILLDDLQTQCHADGIPISSALDRLVGMAYADDLKTVSGTHAGLQNIINKSNDTDLWRLAARYQESHRCQTRAVCADPMNP
jgi:hypothetical protein